jgi:2-octaprenyl-6-methoxyphenol hydroxylase
MPPAGVADFWRISERWRAAGQGCPNRRQKLAQKLGKLNLTGLARLDGRPARRHGAAMSLARFDVAIIGGGPVGALLALALGKAGLRIALIDRTAPPVMQSAAYDGRATAVALGSQRILKGLGLWQRLAEAAGPILDIRVSDGRSRLFLHYDHRSVGDDPLGYIVENRHLRAALATEVAAEPAIVLFAPATVTGLAADATGVTLARAEGAELRATLVVGADGRGSLVRRSAGIAATEWQYGQTALVCSVRHDAPHHGIAHERFLTPGPLALLPLRDPHRCSVVWTERDATAAALLALDDAAFSAEMQARFGESLGRIRIEGRRWSWKLGLHHASRYAAPRLALAGDAAHGIHPIAGQGLNLGWRDVAALAEVLVDARRLGLDIGALAVLERYEAWRRPDTLSLILATDGLNRLFSNDVAPVRVARDVGLGLVNRIAPLKRRFMRQAMGLAGPLPRLVRGEVL